MRLGAFLLLLIALSACSNQEQKIEEQLANVMAVHDSIMPWMDQMHELDEALADQMTVLAEEGADFKPLEKVREDLNESSEMMMIWMSEFKPEEYKKDSKRILRYLESEESKITKIGERMSEAINSSKEALGRD